MLRGGPRSGSPGGATPGYTHKPQRCHPRCLSVPRDATSLPQCPWRCHPGCPCVPWRGRQPLESLEMSPWVAPSVPTDATLCPSTSLEVPPLEPPVPFGDDTPGIPGVPRDATPCSPASPEKPPWVPSLCPGDATSRGPLECHPVYPSVPRYATDSAPGTPRDATTPRPPSCCPRVGPPLPHAPQTRVGGGQWASQRAGSPRWPWGGGEKEGGRLAAPRGATSPPAPAPPAVPRAAAMPARGGLLCATSGLALLLAATATDFWLQYRAPGGPGCQGLWRVCLGGACHPHPGTPALWDATRVLMLLSVLSTTAAIALGLSAASSGAPRLRLRMAGATLLVAGFLALLGLAVFTAVTDSSTSAPPPRT
ncbi:WAS/WASL-interacting protein family member 3-like isoform X2 [Rhea pennata]|uniref:WAS/WASL-interacting protein family member 3-like isoform X2 n=1 Tax=Rhea pennata TaxID=8795 RepID=UPI002E2744F7